LADFQAAMTSLNKPVGAVSSNVEENAEQVKTLKEVLEEREE
jgi:hypothetical protein